MNLILTGIDDSPTSTPFAWLPSLRDRLTSVANDETVPARRLRTLGHAHQLVAIVADLLPQTKGLREIDEADFHELAVALSTAYRRQDNEATTMRAEMWAEVASATRGRHMGKLTDKPHTVIVEDEIIPLVHFLAVVVNILLTLPQTGRVPRELVPLFLMTATGLSGDLAMLTEE
jgi:hypothetical protein